MNRTERIQALEELIAEDPNDPFHKDFGLPDRDDPSFDEAAARVLLEAARDGDTEAAERATEHIIKLIVIFLLQTLVLPLLLLWGLYGVVKRAFEWPGQMPESHRRPL